MRSGNLARAATDLGVHVVTAQGADITAANNDGDTAAMSLVRDDDAIRAVLCPQRVRLRLRPSLVVRSVASLWSLVLHRAGQA